MKTKKSQTEHFSWDTEPESAQSICSESERYARIQLYRSRQIGAITFAKLLKRFESAEAALKEIPALIKHGKLPPSTSLAHPKTIDAEITAHDKIGARLIVAGDRDYPKTFQATPDMPPVLSALGQTQFLNRNIFAIVGARNGSLTGRKIAYHYAQHIGKSDYIIVSGLARGIDGEAHKGSLETGTIAVIAGGIDKIYPYEHEQLYQDIARRGLIITESPFGTEPRADLFPKRNRLIAALSRGVLIIEAAVQSGSISTANYAGDLNVPVYVVPGSPLDPRYAGSNELLRDGAELVTCSEDITDHLASYSPGSHEEHSVSDMFLIKDEEESFLEDTDNFENGAQDPSLLEDQAPPSPEAEILENLSDTPIFLDELIQACSFSTKQVMAALLSLELDERIIRHPGDRVSKVF